MPGFVRLILWNGRRTWSFKTDKDMITDKVIFIHIYRMLQGKMCNPAIAGFMGVLFPKIVWLLSAFNLCIKNGTTILGENITDFFIGYGMFVLSLTNIAITINYKPVFNTEQTLEEVSRELYFHPSRCKVIIYNTASNHLPKSAYRH